MNLGPALQSALEQIEAIGTREIDLIRYANFRRQQRTKRRMKVNEYMVETGYWPLLRWLSDMAPRSFLSIDEARTWLRKEIARLQQMKAMRGADYYGFRDNAHRLPGLRDRLIVARYFSMHGAAIWTREAA